MISAGATNSFSNFLKFIKNKPSRPDESSERVIRCQSPKSGRSPASSIRNRTQSVDSAFEESLLDENFQEVVFEPDQKKSKKSHVKVRRKSLSRKYIAVYNNDEMFYNAVIVGNIELTKQLLLNDNIDVNTQKQFGWTALHHACRLGIVELIKLLLEYGSNIDLLTFEGLSPLMITVIYGNFDAAFYLIHDKGVGSDEIRDGFQETPRLNLVSNVPLKYLSNHTKISKTKSID